MAGTISRRSLLQMLGATGTLMLPARGWGDDGNEHELPAPNASGIDHIVVVTMENRSFDHLLGWLPAANGRQAGLQYPDRNGQKLHTYPLAPDYQGCGHPDPDHSYQGGRTEYNNGACDGWLLAGKNDSYAIGYYTREDLPFLGGAAPAWTAFDNYYAAIMSETFPNRFYLHAGRTDRLDGSMSLSTLPTIWDRLAEKGITHTYYFSDVPFLALWGAKYLGISRPAASFVADALAGKLPAVSYVDPRFLGEENGVSGDDHPHSDIRNGEVFLNAVYDAVVHSPNWSRTVLLLVFDEWGGFFEHVPPQHAPDIGLAYSLRGFRVPCLMISPMARRKYVAHGVYDHTSILKMIEWRWSLPPLSVRDAFAANLARELNFDARDLAAPVFTVPPLVYGAACVSNVAPLTATAPTEWAALRNIALSNGWAV